VPAKNAKKKVLSRADPTSSPRLFLKLLGYSQDLPKKKVAAHMLNFVIGTIPYETLDLIAIKAANRICGKNADHKFVEQFRSECLKNLRAMRKKARKKRTPFWDPRYR
jgi:hypothetical protein